MWVLSDMSSESGGKGVQFSLMRGCVGCFVDVYMCVPLIRMCCQMRKVFHDGGRELEWN